MGILCWEIQDPEVSLGFCPCKTDIYIKDLGYMFYSFFYYSTGQVSCSTIVCQHICSLWGIKKGIWSPIWTNQKDEQNVLVVTDFYNSINKYWRTWQAALLVTQRMFFWHLTEIFSFLFPALTEALPFLSKHSDLTNITT